MFEDEVTRVGETLAALTAALHPDTLPEDAATAVYTGLDRIERLAWAGKTLLAPTVAPGHAGQGGGGRRTGTDAVARHAGTGSGAARDQLATGQALVGLAALAAALRGGHLSATQATLIAAAATTDPTAEHGLLALAPSSRSPNSAPSVPGCARPPTLTPTPPTAGCARPADSAVTPTARAGGTSPPVALPPTAPPSTPCSTHSSTRYSAPPTPPANTHPSRHTPSTPSWPWPTSPPNTPATQTSPTTGATRTSQATQVTQATRTTTVLPVCRTARTARVDRAPPADPADRSPPHQPRRRRQPARCPSRIRCRARPRSLRPRSLRPRSLRPPTHQHRPAIPPTPTSRTTTTQSRPVAGPTPKRSSARPPSHHLTDRASRPPRPHPRRPLPPTRRPPYPRRWVRQTPRRRPQRARRTSYLADGGGPTALPGAAPGRPHRPAPRPGHRDELCEIAGVGPIPITNARDLLGDAVLKLVITRGVDVLHVTHLGRGPTAAQRIALAWTSPHCSVLGCPRTRVQIDHRLDWAHTRHTRLDELDPLCPTTTT